MRSTLVWQLYYDVVGVHTPFQSRMGANVGKTMSVVLRRYSRLGRVTEHLAAKRIAAEPDVDCLDVPTSSPAAKRDKYFASMALI